MPDEVKLLPTRCVEALDKIGSLMRLARTDAVDMVERIQRICDDTLDTRTNAPSDVVERVAPFEEVTVRRQP